MLDFTEFIRVEAPPARVWAALLDIERWWPQSNPEHESIDRIHGAEHVADLGDRGEIGVGSRFLIREKIAGIAGVGVGVVTRMEPGRAVTWEADHMRYRLYSVTFTVGEGVTWRADPSDEPGTSLLSARVWARFPDGLIGRVAWLVFSRLLGGVEKDRHHARVELEYLKDAIKSSPAT